MAAMGNKQSPMRPARRYSDPSIQNESDSPLLQRRNGRHDIFVGVGGDDVLSLFRKHSSDSNFAKSRSYCCTLLTEDGRPVSRGPSIENLGRVSPKTVLAAPSAVSSFSSSTSQSPLLCSSALHVENEQSATDGSTSPRLQQRRNGLCYVNSEDMIVKTIKQKKTATDLQKRNSNVLLQFSW